MNLKLPNEEGENKMDGDGTKTDLDSIELSDCEIPDFKWPTVSIGIESIYGMGGLIGPLAGLSFYRQEKESDKALARRIVREFKQLLLKELKSNEPYREHFEQREAQKK